MVTARKPVARRPNSAGTLEPHPRSGLYYARVTVGVNEAGRPRRKRYPLGTADRTLAKRKLATLVRSLEAGLVVQQDAPTATTFGDYRAAIAHMLNAGDVANLSNHVATHLDAAALDSVTSATVQRVLEKAIAAALNVGTVRKIHGAIRRVYVLAKLDGTLPDAHPNPASFELRWLYKRIEATPKKDQRRRVVLDDAEFFALIDCPEFLPTDVKSGLSSKGRPWLLTEDRVRTRIAPGRVELKMLACVARMQGGMRTSDTSQWDWTMLDIAAFASCTVPRAKTETPQRMEVPEALRPPLRAWWEQQGRPAAGPCFPVRQGRRAGEHKRDRGTSYAARLRRDLVRALAWAGIAPRSELFADTATTRRVDFHSFRRSFVSAARDAGVNVQTAMALAGHKDPRVHMGYVDMQKAIPTPSAVLPQRPALATAVAKRRKK